MRFIGDDNMAERIRVLFVCAHGVGSASHANTFRNFLAKNKMDHLFSVDHAYEFLTHGGFEDKVLNSDHVVVTNPVITIDKVRQIVRDARASIPVHDGTELWRNWRHAGWCAALLDRIKPDWR